MKTVNQDIYLEIDKYERDIFEVVENIKCYILTHECPFLVVDISKLNMIDASKISILCSTFHFSKYQEGSITWYVADSETQQCIRRLRLKNVRTELKTIVDDTLKYFDKKYRSNIH